MPTRQIWANNNLKKQERRYEEDEYKDEDERNKE